jgi:hypothetical protein
MPIKIEFPSLADRQATIGLAEYLSDPTLTEAKKRWLKDDLELLWRLYVESVRLTPARFTGMDVETRNILLEEARWRYPVKKPRGRKLKWNVWTAGLLVVEVERAMTPARWTCDSVTDDVSKQKPWDTFIEGGDADDGKVAPKEVVRVMYSKWYKNPKIDVVREAYVHCLMTGNLKKWDEILTVLTLPE